MLRDKSPFIDGRNLFRAGFNYLPYIIQRGGAGGKAVFVGLWSSPFGETYL